MIIICHLCLILGVIVLADDSHPNWIPHRVLKHSLSLTILQAWFDDFPIHHQIIIKSFLVHLFEQGFGGDEWTIPIINLHTNTFFSPTVAQLNGSRHANAVTERKAIFTKAGGPRRVKDKEISKPNESSGLSHHSALATDVDANI